MSTVVCLSFGDSPQKSCGIKTNFSNAVGCDLKLLKIEPEIKNTLIFSVQSENLIRVNGCRLTLVKEFLHISGMVWFIIEIPVSTRSHWFNAVYLFPNLFSFRFLASVSADIFLSFLATNWSKSWLQWLVWDSYLIGFTLASILEIVACTTLSWYMKPSSNSIISKSGLSLITSDLC